MKFRTALVIIAVFAISVFMLPKAIPVQSTSYRPDDTPMRAVMLPPIPPPPTTTTTTTTVPPPTTTTTSPPAPPVVASVPSDYAAWTRVADCEEGGWIGYAGPAYPDSLGINAHNWWAYGGGTDLSPAAQIAVAQRIEAAAGNAGYVPDQNGCAAW